MELELTDEEMQLLRQLLKNRLPDLREEVYKTERYEWRQELKQDEEVLKGLIAKLDQLAAREPEL
jgi:hypothetical protein